MEPKVAFTTAPTAKLLCAEMLRRQKPLLPTAVTSFVSFHIWSPIGGGGKAKYYLAMPIPIKYERGIMEVMAVVNLVIEVK